MYTGETRRVVVMVYDGVDLLDLAGPCEAFHLANLAVSPAPPTAADAFGALGPSARRKGPQPYSVELAAAASSRRVVTSFGVPLEAHRTLAGVGPLAGVDTLLVPGGDQRGPSADPAVLRLLRRAPGRVRRVVSVCSGAVVLAAAGLLDGRRATTHWLVCDELAAAHPAVRVEPDPIFVADGGVFTSAGGTAGIDLALSLIEADLGREVALRVARYMVVFLRRPGGQSQFSDALRAQQQAAGDPVRELVAWAAANPAADLSVEALAGRAHMSVRNFTRVFRRETGQSPARCVERLRVEAARRRLEDGAAAEGVARVARACGFGSADSMRRSFVRVLGVAPAGYRDRFRPAPGRP